MNFRTNTKRGCYYLLAIAIILFMSFETTQPKLCSPQWLKCDWAHCWASCYEFAEVLLQEFFFFKNWERQEACLLVLQLSESWGDSECTMDTLGFFLGSWQVQVKPTQRCTYAATLWRMAKQVEFFGVPLTLELFVYENQWSSFQGKKNITTYSLLKKTWV